MKTTQSLLAAVALSVGMLSATGANAALESALGGQVVNDTDLNLTWLANANLAATETFGVGGIILNMVSNQRWMNGWMKWNTAQSWIGAMNTANYLGYNDWRLPTTLQPDASCSSQYQGSSGYNCTGSEMGHLFYNELGGVAGSSIRTTHNADFALFNNVQTSNNYGGSFYWSGTEFAPATSNEWYFNMYQGNQSTYGKSSYMYAWAVRPGQVSAVPEPETYAMLSAGLGLIGFMARRRKDLTA